jgi:hypothetical protein
VRISHTADTQNDVDDKAVLKYKDMLVEIWRMWNLKAKIVKLLR